MTGLRIATAALVVTASAVRVDAQSVAAGRDGRIDLRAESSAIGRVLRDLAALAPIRLLVDPAVEGKTVVTPAASGLTADLALEAVLAASKQPYLVWGGTKGPWRVVVGDEASAVEVTAAPSPTAAALEVDAGPPVGSSDAVEAYQAREAERSQQAEIEREAEAQPIVVSDDASVPGGYTLTHENVTYNDPNFVPYKSRPEVQARRRAVDVTKIP